MSITGDTANHDWFVHSTEVCALFPTRIDRLRWISRTTWCLRNGWPRHSLSETLTLYSGQTIPNLQPSTCWSTSSRASCNLLNYARAHNSLWLHTEVSSMNNLMIPLSLGGGPYTYRQHWVLQVPQSTQMWVLVATLGKPLLTISHLSWISLNPLHVYEHSMAI